MMSRATVEVIAFPYAEFQACVITGKAKTEWPHTTEIYITSFFLLVLSHDSSTPTCRVATIPCPVPSRGTGSGTGRDGFFQRDF